MATEKKSVEDVMAILNKTYGEGSIMEGETIIDVEKIKTGSLGLDIALGGGYGEGRFIEIYGQESSGKSTLSIYAMINAQQKYPNKKVLFIDMEQAFDKSYAKGLGLDTDSLIITQPDNGDQAIDIVIQMIDTGEISLIVVDSIATLIPLSEIEGDIQDKQMGLHARLMSKACRMISPKASKTGTTVIWINQLREKIGISFGNPNVTTGGNAMKFYASQRIELLKRKGKEDKEGVISNNTVTAKVIKNKLAPPYAKCTFDIVFKRGINKAKEVIDLGTDLKIIERKGSWFSYEGTSIGQGAEGAALVLEDNVELWEEIEAKIKKKLTGGE